MSRSDETNSDNLTCSLREVEAFWHATLPETFRRLYARVSSPFLAPCEFFDLGAIASGAGRGYGMTPQYLPFGRSVGDGGLYGFYVLPATAMESWPVLYWDEDEMCIRPVASDFTAFVRHCVLVGRYDSEEQLDEERDGQSERTEIVQRLDLETKLLTAPPPRNDRELHERLVALDPQDTVSLCHLACTWRNLGDDERALDFLHRATESAPWFGNSYYLLADIYRERENYGRATQGWWSVVSRMLSLCTRTWEWDLGAEHPEADIYEVAADGLAQHVDDTDPDIRQTALWQVVVHDDPYDPDVREALASALLNVGDNAGAEREYLNALSLCSSESSRQPDRLYDALISLYRRIGRARDAALASFDRQLPRPTL